MRSTEKLLKLGIEVAQSTVSIYMVPQPRSAIADAPGPAHIVPLALAKWLHCCCRVSARISRRNQNMCKGGKRSGR